MDEEARIMVFIVQERTTSLDGLYKGSKWIKAKVMACLSLRLGVVARALIR
jgi:hypothetical protein